VHRSFHIEHRSLACTLSQIVSQGIQGRRRQFSRSRMQSWLASRSSLRPPERFVWLGLHARGYIGKRVSCRGLSCRINYNHQHADGWDRTQISTGEIRFCLVPYHKVVTASSSRSVDGCKRPSEARDLHMPPGRIVCVNIVNCYLRSIRNTGAHV